MHKLVVRLLMACALPHASFGAPGRPSCDETILEAGFERAWEAREDHFFWDGIDERESAAELERFVLRLRYFLQAHEVCAAPGADGLLRRAREQIARAARAPDVGRLAGGR